MEWHLIEVSDQERILAAKVSGGILVRYEESVGVNLHVQVTYVLGASLRKAKDGLHSIVKGK